MNNQNIEIGDLVQINPKLEPILLSGKVGVIYKVISIEYWEWSVNTAYARLDGGKDGEAFTPISALQYVDMSDARNLLKFKPI